MVGRRGLRPDTGPPLEEKQQDQQLVDGNERERERERERLTHMRSSQYRKVSRLRMGGASKDLF